ncbi:hypothetical protein YC2023_052779 [Brassica napus]
MLNELDPFLQSLEESKTPTKVERSDLGKKMRIPEDSPSDRKINVFRLHTPPLEDLSWCSTCCLELCPCLPSPQALSTADQLQRKENPRVAEGSITPWILLQIWIARNNLMFNDKHRSPEDTLSREIANASEWNSSQWIFFAGYEEGPLKMSVGESKLRTLRSQLDLFDKAWCTFFYSFVIWKVKDAWLLEDDKVRAACQLVSLSFP